MKVNLLKFKVTDPKYTPSYETRYSAGCDLMSREEVVLKNGETRPIATGVFIDPSCVDALLASINEDVEGEEILIPEIQIRSRSGLSIKGLVVANSTGTVDIDYKDEIKVILRNQSGEDKTIKDGDRIAQMVIALTFRLSPDLFVKNVTRNGGFGSTGSGK